MSSCVDTIDETGGDVKNEAREMGGVMRDA
mgnify:CR=1 FL=1